MRKSFPAFVRRRIFMFFVVLVISFLLINWCFDLEAAVQDATLVVPNQISWLLGIPTPLDTKEPSPDNFTETFNVTGIPEDVQRDGNRSNTSTEGLCPLVPPNLVGYIPTKLDVHSLDMVEDEFPQIESGGRFRPKECTSRHKVAILVPYRNRSEHLPIFIYNIHKVLSRQQLDYGVFVIEQVDNEEFNRGALFNVGYLESTRQYDYQCFIFHDIDLVPADDRNVYTCPEHPRHMSVRIGYRSGVPYMKMFGGVSALNKEHMLLVNGYSNKYWGWGGEDDDIVYRMHDHNLKIHRRPSNVAKYTALEHEKAKPSDNRHQILRKWKERYKTDGVNSAQYKLLGVEYKKLFTWIMVDLSVAK